MCFFVRRWTATKWHTVAHWPPCLTCWYLSYFLSFRTFCGLQSRGAPHLGRLEVEAHLFLTVLYTKVCLKSPGKDPKASSAHSPGRSVQGLMKQTLHPSYVEQD